MKSLVIEKNLRLLVFKMKLNRNSVPEGMAFYRPDPGASPSRPARAKGERIVPGRICDIGPLANEIAQTHALVDAFYTNEDSGYVCAHFVLSVKEHAKVETRIMPHQLALQNYLRRLLTQSFWTTDAYINPFIHEDEVVEGVHSASIICRNFLFKAGKTAEYALGTSPALATA